MGVASAARSVRAAVTVLGHPAYRNPPDQSSHPCSDVAPVLVNGYCCNPRMLGGQPAPESVRRLARPAPSIAAQREAARNEIC